MKKGLETYAHKYILKIMILSIVIRTTLVTYTIPVVDNPAGFFGSILIFILYFFLCVSIQIIPITIKIRNINVKEPSLYFGLIKKYLYYGIPIHIIIGFSFFPFFTPIIFSFLPDLVFFIIVNLKTKSKR